MEPLISRNTKALAALPLWRRDKLEGFAVLEDSYSQRYWWPEEIMLFLNVCMLIAGTL